MPKRPTVELPKYVQRVVDGGREYFYFQKGRCSSMPGPRMKLPNGPHDAEFWATYKSYLGSEPPSARTFDALIAAYKAAPEFTKRAETTQRDYSRYLDIVSKAWGKLHVGSVRPKHVIQLRDAWVETPVAANHLLSVLKTLIKWGIPREFSETNPCVHVPKLEVEEDGARPWPVWAYGLIEEARAGGHAASGRPLRAIPARGRPTSCAWPQRTSRTAASTSCNRRLARSCGSPYMLT